MEMAEACSPLESSRSSSQQQSPSPSSEPPLHPTSTAVVLTSTDSTTAVGTTTADPTAVETATIFSTAVNSTTVDLIHNAEETSRCSDQLLPTPGQLKTRVPLRRSPLAAFSPSAFSPFSGFFSCSACPVDSPCSAFPFSAISPANRARTALIPLALLLVLAAILAVFPSVSPTVSPLFSPVPSKSPSTDSEDVRVIDGTVSLSRKEQPSSRKAAVSSQDFAALLWSSPSPDPDAKSSPLKPLDGQSALTSQPPDPRAANESTANTIAPITEAEIRPDSESTKRRNWRRRRSGNLTGTVPASPTPHNTTLISSAPTRHASSGGSRNKQSRQRVKQMAALEKATVASESTQESPARHASGGGGRNKQARQRMKQLAALEKATVNISSLDDPLVIQRLTVPHRVEWETEWLPVSRQEFFHPDRKYLFVTGDRDMCAGIKHFRTSLECRIQEARYLNRTLVLDMRVCLNGLHNNGKFVYKGIHNHFDLSSIRGPFTPLQGFLEEALSWERARTERKGKRGGGEGSVAVRVVQRTAGTDIVALDTVTPLIIRQTSYGYSTCKMRGPLNRDEGGVRFRPELLALAANISQAMNGGDYDAVHVRRGDKLNPRLWPHLDDDTRPAALLKTLPRFVDPGRTLYIATNERTPGFFDPLRRVYDIRMWVDFTPLWSPGTVWYDGYEKIMRPSPTLDAYMEVIVEYTVTTMAKRVVETFNDLTSDPAGGRFR